MQKRTRKKSNFKVTLSASTSLNNLDLTEVTRIHYDVLNQSFLNNFGIKALELIYQGLNHDRVNNIFIVAYSNQTVIGYIIASKNPLQTITNALLYKPLSLGVQITLVLLKNPLLLLKIISISRVTTEINVQAELQFMAVTSSFQRYGIGKKLLKKLNRELRKANVKQYTVGTKKESIVSNGFYRKHGFKLLYSRKIFGDNFNYYISPIIKPDKNRLRNNKRDKRR